MYLAKFESHPKLSAIITFFLRISTNVCLLIRDSSHHFDLYIHYIHMIVYVNIELVELARN